jgi:protein-tyrosine phosphatase
MPLDPITPPPSEEQDAIHITSVPADSVAESHPTVVQRRAIKFSYLRWASAGVTRLLYRSWTRIAVRLFPEDSKGEQVAHSLHLPLPDRLNMSWVNSQLAVGGRIRPADIQALARVGVTHVIDTRSEYADDVEALAREHIELLYLPTPDTHALSIEQLMQGASWANDRILHGGRVLIHCEHGVGRSVLLTCATLVYDGMHARDALDLVQEKRWQAAPNHRQIQRLREFEQTLLAQRKA